MAYNYFPVGYQPFYQPTPQTAPQAQNTPQNGIQWVQGIEGAKAFVVPAGSTVQLWDSEDTVIYLKSADATGLPSMKILHYTIDDPTSQPTVDMSVYVTREEFEKAIAELTPKKEKKKDA